MSKDAERSSSMQDRGRVKWAYCRTLNLVDHNVAGSIRTLGSMGAASPPKTIERQLMYVYRSNHTRACDKGKSTIIPHVWAPAPNPAPGGRARVHATTGGDRGGVC